MKITDLNFTEEWNDSLTILVEKRGENGARVTRYFGNHRTSSLTYRIFEFKDLKDLNEKIKNALKQIDYAKKDYNMLHSCNYVIN